MGITIKLIDIIIKLHKLITDINTNMFCITSYHEYANDAFIMQISSTITGNFNFINFSADINKIQIIIVSTPMFSWARNIFSPIFDSSHVYHIWFLSKLVTSLPEIIIS